MRIISTYVRGNWPNDEWSYLRKTQSNQRNRGVRPIYDPKWDVALRRRT
jgi:hypothetical protein